MTVAATVTRPLAIATTVRPLPKVSASALPNSANNLIARFIDDSSELDGDYQAMAGGPWSSGLKPSHGNEFNTLYTGLTHLRAVDTLNGHDSAEFKLRKAASMKNLILFPAAFLTGGLCLAQEVGNVISSTPVVQQVAVPRQVCSIEQVAVQQPKSGAGALVGAIAGGAMGNAVGGGTGKAAATIIGIIGGAVVGDSIEGTPTSQFQNVQRCATQNFYENRIVAYNVAYEFGGRQYSVQLPRDPGPTIELQVTPVGGSEQTTPPRSNATYVQSGYQQPAYVVSAPQVYSGYAGYYNQPNYVPVAAAAVGLGFLIGNQGHGYGYGHGRWH